MNKKYCILFFLFVVHPKSISCMEFTDFFQKTPTDLNKQLLNCPIEDLTNVSQVLKEEDKKAAPENNCSLMENKSIGLQIPLINDLYSKKSSEEGTQYHTKFSFVKLKQSNVIKKIKKIKRNKNGEHPTRYCHYCNKGLSNKGSLYNHEKYYCRIAREKNIIQKNFTCNIPGCRATFSRIYDLRNHREKCARK